MNSIGPGILLVGGGEAYILQIMPNSHTLHNARVCTYTRYEYTLAQHYTGTIQHYVEYAVIKMILLHAPVGRMDTYSESHVLSKMVSSTTARA